MLLFELVITLLLVGAVLALWSDRLGIPCPALLALAGAVLALIPGSCCTPAPGQPPAQ